MELMNLPNAVDIIVLDNADEDTRVRFHENLKHCCGSKLEKASITHIHGDVSEESVWEGISKVRNIDYLVHLAANTGVQPSFLDPHRDAIVNIIGSVYALEFSRRSGVKLAIFASSSAPLGSAEPPFSEQTMGGEPLSPYGVSKAAMEHYCHVYQTTYGLNVVALRFSNVYGLFSSHKTSIVARTINRILDNRMIEIFGSGFQTRDFLFASDLAKAIVAMQEKISTDPGFRLRWLYQLGTGAEVSILNLVGFLQTISYEILGREPAVLFKKSLVGEIERAVSDISLFSADFDWRPEHHLKDGLSITFKHLLSSRS